MRTLDQVKAVLSEGAVIRTVENTYRPELNGTRRRVTKLGRTYFRYEMLDGEQVGTVGYTNLPLARDVLEVTDEQVTFRLAVRPGHTVTLRREET